MGARKVGRWVDVITGIFGTVGAVKDDVVEREKWRALMAAIDNLETAVNDLGAKVDAAIDKLNAAGVDQGRVQAAADAVAADAQRLADATK